MDSIKVKPTVASSGAKEALKNEYERRLRKLAGRMSEIFADIQCENICAALRHDPQSSLFIHASLGEVVEKAILQEKEEKILELLDRLVFQQKKEAELADSLSKSQSQHSKLLESLNEFLKSSNEHNDAPHEESGQKSEARNRSHIDEEANSGQIIESLRNLRHSNNTLKQSNEKLLQENRGIQDDNIKLREDRLQAKAHAQSLSTKLQAQESAVSSLQKEKDELKAQVDSQAGQIKLLEQRILEKAKESVNAQVAAGLSQREMKNLKLECYAKMQKCAETEEKDRQFQEKYQIFKQESQRYLNELIKYKTAYGVQKSCLESVQQQLTDVQLTLHSERDQRKHTEKALKGCISKIKQVALSSDITLSKEICQQTSHFLNEIQKLHREDLDACIDRAPKFLYNLFHKMGDQRAKDFGSILHHFREKLNVLAQRAPDATKQALNELEKDENLPKEAKISDEGPSKESSETNPDLRSESPFNYCNSDDTTECSSEYFSNDLGEFIRSLNKALQTILNRCESENEQLVKNHLELSNSYAKGTKPEKKCVEKYIRGISDAEKMLNNLKVALKYLEEVLKNVKCTRKTLFENGCSKAYVLFNRRMHILKTEALLLSKEVDRRISQRKPQSELLGTSTAKVFRLDKKLKALLAKLKRVQDRVEDLGDSTTHEKSSALKDSNGPCRKEEIEYLKRVIHSIQRDLTSYRKEFYFIK